MKRKRQNKLLTVGLVPPTPLKPMPGIRAERFFEEAPPPPLWDGRRTTAPPDFYSSRWAWQHVEFALRGALRVIKALPYQPGDRPAEHAIAWPDYVQDYPDTGIRGPRPTGEQVDQAMIATRWINTVIAGRIRRGLTAYCAGVKWKKVKEFAGDHRTPRHLSRLYQGEFIRISHDLNAESALEPKNVANVAIYGL